MRDYKMGDILYRKSTEHAPINLRDPEGCVFWLHPHARDRANTFSNHCIGLKLVQRCENKMNSDACKAS